METSTPAPPPPTDELVRLAPQTKRPTDQDWLRLSVSEDEAADHLNSGGNLGLRNEHYPALDIDVKDSPREAERISYMLSTALGPAPERSRSNSSSRALQYATHEPFPRQVLEIDGIGQIEARGVGCQTMIYGMHDSGVEVEWTESPLETDLTTIKLADVERGFDRIAQYYEKQGRGVRRLGRSEETPTPEQADLLAPDLAAATAILTATDIDGPDLEERTGWLTTITAYKASLRQEDWNGGLDAVQEWCAGSEQHANDPDYIEQTWQSLKPPFRVGYQYLLDRVEPALSAAEEFTADPNATPPEPAEPEAERRIFSFDELLERPELLEPPERLSLFAWRGKLSVISGREKLARKSTLAGWDAAEASRNDRRIGHLTYEEDAGDSLRRWVLYRAEKGGRVHYLDRIPNNKEIEQAIADLGLDVLYVDSLAAWLSGTGQRIPKSHEGEESQAVVQALKEIAYRQEMGIVLIAHASKHDEDGGIRGSTGFGAAADMLCRIRPPKSERSPYREISFLGRWMSDHVKVRFDTNNIPHIVTKDEDPEGSFETLGDEPAVYFAVLQSDHGELSTTEIRDKLKWRKDRLRRVLERLVEQGIMEREGSSNTGYTYAALAGWRADAEGKLLIPDDGSLLDGELGGSSTGQDE